MSSSDDEDNTPTTLDANTSTERITLTVISPRKRIPEFVVQPRETVGETRRRLRSQLLTATELAESHDDRNADMQDHHYRVVLTLHGQELIRDGDTWGHSSSSSSRTTTTLGATNGDKLYASVLVIDRTTRGGLSSGLTSNSHGALAGMKLEKAEKSRRMEQMMPMLDMMASQPGFMDAILGMDPGLKSFVDKHPEVAEVLHDPQAIKDLMRAQADPTAAAQQSIVLGMRMSEIEDHPLGGLLLDRALTDIKDSERDAAGGSSRQRSAADTSEATEEHARPVVGQTANNAPLPNPWATTTAAATTNTTNTTTPPSALAPGPRGGIGFGNNNINASSSNLAATRTPAAAAAASSSGGGGSGNNAMLGAGGLSSTSSGSSSGGGGGGFFGLGNWASATGGMNSANSTAGGSNNNNSSTNSSNNGYNNNPWLELQNLRQEQQQLQQQREALGGMFGGGSGLASLLGGGGALNSGNNNSSSYSSFGNSAPFLPSQPPNGLGLSGASPAATTTTSPAATATNTTNTNNNPTQHMAAITELRDMGFEDDTLMHAAVQASGGSVEGAIEYIAARQLE